MKAGAALAPSEALRVDLDALLAILRERDRELAVSFGDLIGPALAEEPAGELRDWIETLPGMPIGKFLAEVKKRCRGAPLGCIGEVPFR